MELHNSLNMNIDDFFDLIWLEVIEKVGENSFNFPKKIILIGGAPGSGKGTNAKFIAQSIGIPESSIIIMSSLLNTPEAKAIKDKGMLVGDREVIVILILKLMEEQFKEGIIIDGFPRTKIQSESFKLLVSKINSLNKNIDINVINLFVDEKTSIERQLNRGKEIQNNNNKVKSTGVGEIQDLRLTDFSVEAAKNRYDIFIKETFSALKSFDNFFNYLEINAMENIDCVRSEITKKLQMLENI